MGQTDLPDFDPERRPHVPVLLSEVLEALAPLEGAHVLDGTFGAGGYSRALLEAGASVIGIDRDPDVAPFAVALAQRFPEKFSFVAGAFSELDVLAGEKPVDGVVLDIGVSSMQLDAGERGFSFMREGPLDMRMASAGTSAADLVNGLEESELASLLFAYGEERKARRIAHAVIVARAKAPITTTIQLARLIETTIGRKPGALHPATRSFQALRTAVNAEFDELVEGLFASERALPPGGRLAVVAFHSLEDRIVKRFLDSGKGGPARSRHLPQTEAEAQRWVNLAKARKAGPEEVRRNPRARSAILRTARRSGAPARPVSTAGLGVPGFRGAP